ncbi:serine/threonine protein kinase US3 [Felid alphaherpesvirus 1]|uniref:Serine/threonine protein kinase US3 n=3 Tax=Feline herpesvirus 1 TaxID=10334 RepID=A0A173DXD1_FHV1|nr:serine/threonine protein kinase US3 [Felid alphaherpesvirus 1]ALJ84169.1 serine/threonine protein kinase US3 [Felid alphaherpesvirus 1]ALJ84245.1 serine/threonine protein kinase US3 [Felid alphaherpesvirus 1]ALJ84321.1 serine/threonine protein kinase US3 [Felid alphaherpesvirus 1]ALJ84397.1 serine/threonine protein kinase US3 [Felid alphaherpesvirus 1]
MDRFPRVGLSCCIPTSKGDIDTGDNYKLQSTMEDVSVTPNEAPRGMLDDDLYSDISDGDFEDICDDTDTETSDSDDESLKPTKQEALEAVHALNYTIVKTLTPGSEGRVFVAKPPGSETPVVLKIGMKGATLIEALLLQNINHESIIKLLDTLFYKELTCIVLPRYKSDLYTYLSNNMRPLSLASAFTIQKQILKGLNYLHQHKIIHRDIKIENILIDDESSVCIGDLGAAQFPVNAPDFLGVAGTVETNSPEVLAKDAYNSKADIWSAGIILFEMIAYPHSIFDDEDSSDSSRSSRNHLRKVITTLKVHPEEFPGDPTSKLTIDFIHYASCVRQPYTRYDCMSKYDLPLDGEFVVHKMLTFDAKFRPSAAEILNYPMFRDT